MQFTSGGAKIFYHAQGEGEPLVLLHPFPTNHSFWKPLAAELAARYRLLMPDLRGHGASEGGPGAITMAAHCADLEGLLAHNKIGKAIFFGVSIGGYILLEFWRRRRERVQALILCDTRAQADSEETRAARIKSVAQVLTEGPDQYLAGMVPKLMGATTLRNRPEVAATARKMMAAMRTEGMAGVLLGMAERSDSRSTLKRISVPTLVIVGEEDTLTPAADAELMHQEIHHSELARIPAAGHYAPLEQPQAVLKAVRRFLDAQGGRPR